MIKADEKVFEDAMIPIIPLYVRACIEALESQLWREFWLKYNIEKK
jgi:hypothetical protein